MTEPNRYAYRSAAKTLSNSSTALTLFHTYYDDARQRGLPPHHSINLALGKLSEFPGEPPAKG